MEKVLPHLSALLFVLSCEIIAWRADSSPGNVCCVSSQMKEISHLLPSLKLYGQNQLFILPKSFFQILVNYCVCVCVWGGGQEWGPCFVLASPNYFFAITQANICIKLCIPLKHPYQTSCFCLRYSGKCNRKLK